MGEKKNIGRKDDEWVGKHKVFVTTYFPSSCYVVDLKENRTEMQNPHKVLTKGCPGSVGVVLENTIIAYTIGGGKGAFEYGGGDYNHPGYGTSKSVLDLKTDPPKWSKWEDCEAEFGIRNFFPKCVTHGNKIFAFGWTPIGQVYDTNKIRGAEWEDLLMPSGPPPDVNYTVSNVFSDPKNNRLILHFGGGGPSCLYAYYPDKDEESRWECLKSNIEGRYLDASGLLFDDVIYFCHAPYFFFAYDVCLGIWLNVSWLGEELEDWDVTSLDGERTMIHLGDGMMCLLLDDEDPDPLFPRVPRVVLHMLRFRVRRPSDKDVELYPVSRHTVVVGGGDAGRAVSYAPF